MKMKLVTFSAVIAVLLGVLSCTKDQKALVDCIYTGSSEDCERFETEESIKEARTIERDSVEVIAGEPIIVE